MTTKTLRTGLAGAVLVAVGTLTAQGAAAQELYIYNWSNYIPPELLERFEEETGIKVTLDVYDSNETMMGKLQAGATGYDIIVPTDYIVPRLIDGGLIQKIDASSMENFKNLKPAFTDPPYDPGRAYTVPYMWGTTGFSYDSARVDGELEESWKEFFEPRESLKGQIVALNDMNDVISSAAFYLGYERCFTEPEKAQAVLDLLEGQKPYLAMYQSDGTIERMGAGEVIMHQQWNGAAHRTKQALPTVTYVYPKEGLPFWADNMAIPTGAKNVEEAKIFLNWMMEPRNAAETSNFTGYMNAVEGSDQFLEPALANDPAVNMPDEYSDRLRPAEDCPREAQDLRDRIWTKLKS